MNEDEKTTLIDLTSDEVLHDPDPSFASLLQEVMNDIKVLVEEGKDVAEGIVEITGSLKNFIAYNVEFGMEIAAQFDALRSRGMTESEGKHAEKITAIFQKFQAV